MPDQGEIGVTSMLTLSMKMLVSRALVLWLNWNSMVCVPPSAKAPMSTETGW